MGMIKQDFVLLGTVLNDLRDNDVCTNECVDKIAIRLANTYDETYTRFVRDEFLLACGVEAEQ
jgi:hypothetical protein